mgnify:CR=1 FL=1
MRVERQQTIGLVRERVAIITGAARGIGAAVAGMLVSHGARVVLVDRDREALEACAAAFSGEQVEVCCADLLDGDAPAAIVDAAISRWGAIDIIVNNAGFTWDGPLHTMADEQWASMLDIHATAPFRLLRAAAPHLRDPAKAARESGGVPPCKKVVNITSISGTMGNAAQTNYAAGKAAVVGMTRALAKEWGQFNICVNAVAFGFIDTRLTQERDADNTISSGHVNVQLGVPAHVRDMVEAFTPLGRLGSVEDAAGPVLFLCSPWSDYITGQVLTVSGGLPFGME